MLSQLLKDGHEWQCWLYQHNERPHLQALEYLIKKRGWRDTKGCPTLEPSGKQEERKTKKQLEKIGNQGRG